MKKKLILMNSNDDKHFENLLFISAEIIQIQN